MSVHAQVAGRPAAAHGVIFIHACPSAVSPHLGWALNSVFGTEIRIDWDPQPIAPGQQRAEIIWSGPAGTATKIASSLSAFRDSRYEVYEDPSASREGERFSFTPSLGLFRATIGPHGDVQVPEDRLRTAVASSVDLASDINRLIGQPWDDELEPFRCAHVNSTVRVLHQVV
jgi:hypothetical protein